MFFKAIIKFLPGVFQSNHKTFQAEKIEQHLSFEVRHWSHSAAVTESMFLIFLPFEMIFSFEISSFNVNRYECLSLEVDLKDE